MHIFPQKRAPSNNIFSVFSPPKTYENVRGLSLGSIDLIRRDRAKQVHTEMNKGIFVHHLRTRTVRYRASNEVNEFFYGYL